VFKEFFLVKSEKRNSLCLTLLIGLIVMVVLPAIRIAAWAILALGILLMAAAFIIDFRRVSGAITGRHFTTQQIMAEIEGVLV